MKNFLYYIMPFIVTPALMMVCSVFNRWELLNLSIFLLCAVSIIASAVFGFFSPTNKKFDYLMTFIMPLSFFFSMYIEGLFSRGEMNLWYNIDCARLLAYQPVAMLSYPLMAIVTFIASYKGFRKFKDRIIKKIKTDSGKIVTFKTSAIIATVLGSAILILNILVPIVMLVFGSNQDNATIGIIGGADVSLLSMIVFTADSLDRIILGVTLLLIGVLGLIFRKTIFANCTFKSGVLTLSASFFSALALSSIGFWYCLAAFGEKPYSPIGYPASIVATFLSLFAVIISIVLYVKERKNNPRVKGIIIDVLTLILTFPFLLEFCLAMRSCFTSGYLAG